MPAKPLPCPERIRRVPEQFSWIDQRLVREHHIDRCTHPAGALYLFLLTVADARGLSYYSDAALMQRLSMSSQMLLEARENLIHVDLMAFKHPFYQVLSINGSPSAPKRTIPTHAEAPSPLPEKIVNGGLSSTPKPVSQYIEQMRRSLS